ncbi:MAG: hypothetical protein KVP17_003861 [Porospora cf. gigantea B]|uniref:uncharacterized protein n=1 Tax=Porospora cf. gigantea B TaxID=2853592 RepID=UPI003571D9D9|nr:MAG: hypothetical protein KVP17_003861 [Porospora cf. gigantea B]
MSETVADWSTLPDFEFATPIAAYQPSAQHEYEAPEDFRVAAFDDDPPECILSESAPHPPHSFSWLLALLICHHYWSYFNPKTSFVNEPVTYEIRTRTMTLDLADLSFAVEVLRAFEVDVVGQSSSGTLLALNPPGPCSVLPKLKSFTSDSQLLNEIASLKDVTPSSNETCDPIGDVLQPDRPPKAKRLPEERVQTALQFLDTPPDLISTMQLDTDASWVRAMNFYLHHPFVRTWLRNLPMEAKQSTAKYFAETFQRYRPEVRHGKDDLVPSANTEFNLSSSDWLIADSGMDFLRTLVLGQEPTTCHRGPLCATLRYLYESAGEDRYSHLVKTGKLVKIKTACGGLFEGVLDEFELSIMR